MRCSLSGFETRGLSVNVNSGYRDYNSAAEEVVRTIKDGVYKSFGVDIEKIGKILYEACILGVKMAEGVEKERLEIKTIGPENALKQIEPLRGSKLYMLMYNMVKEVDTEKFAYAYQETLDLAIRVANATSYREAFELAI